MEEVVDDFIGRKFGKDGQVEVLSKDAKEPTNHGRKYTCICHKCKLDSELYLDGIFHTSKADLLKGKLSCGCSKSPRLSQRQWKVVIERKCNERQYELLEVGEWKGQDTYLTLKCLIDGTVWSSGTISNFLRDRSCPVCAAQNRADNRELSVDESTRLFMATGKYKKGTVFSRVNKRGRMWQYTCPVCSNDEYVQAGLCSGVFKSDRTNFISGKLTCRCSDAPRWNTAKREFQIKSIIEANDLGYTFVRWSNTCGYKTPTDKFFLSCPIFGEFEKSISNFVDNGALHPNGRDSDPERVAHLYVLKISGTTNDFTGYGISAKIENRLSQHRVKLSHYGFKIESYKTFETTWRSACIIEAQIGQTFDLYPQEVSGFMTEATHAHLFSQVVDFVQKQLDNNVTASEITD